MNEITPQVVERFWKFVDKRGPDDCWPWLGEIGRRGYGVFYIKQQGRRAHRVSEEIERGPIPFPLEVCHTCDNPNCVNPRHLFRGTHRQNMLDCLSKGRMVKVKISKGEEHPHHKLTDDAVREIRSLYKPNVFGSKRLAQRFGVSDSTIKSLLKGETWLHVK